MIISCSRKTDLPRYYAPWLVKRLQDQVVEIVNPMNAKQVKQVSLQPDHVEGLVFWTRNPLPLLAHRELLEAYQYYFQYSLTAYGPDIEVNEVPLSKRMTWFKEASRLVGRDKIFWRYDPIVFSDELDLTWHLKQLTSLVRELAPYASRLTISFYQEYRYQKKKKESLGLRPPNKEEEILLLQAIKSLAHEHGLSFHVCCSHGSLDYPGQCVDEGVFGVSGKRDPHQRKACSCSKSVDIGMYHTCLTSCIYCYATSSPERALKNYHQHDPDDIRLISPAKK